MQTRSRVEKLRKWKRWERECEKGERESVCEKGERERRAFSGGFSQKRKEKRKKKDVFPTFLLIDYTSQLARYNSSYAFVPAGSSLLLPALTPPYMIRCTVCTVHTKVERRTTWTVMKRMSMELWIVKYVLCSVEKKGERSQENVRRLFTGTSWEKHKLHIYTWNLELFMYDWPSCRITCTGPLTMNLQGKF